MKKNTYAYALTLTALTAVSQLANAAWQKDYSWQNKDQNTAERNVMMTEVRQGWIDAVNQCGITAIKIIDVKNDGVRLFDVAVKLQGNPNPVSIANFGPQGKIIDNTPDKNPSYFPGDDTKSFAIPGAGDDGACVESIIFNGNASRDGQQNDKPAQIVYDTKVAVKNGWIEEFYPMGQAVKVTGNGAARSAIMNIQLDNGSDVDTGVTALRFDADYASVELLELNVTFCAPNMPVQTISLYGADAIVNARAQVVDVQPGPGHRWVTLDSNIPNKRVELQGDKRCVKSVTAKVRASMQALDQNITPSIQAFAVKGRP